MRFATGYRLDPAGHQRSPFARLAARRGLGSFPAIVTLLAFAPAVLDQNQTSSCTGGATSAALYTAFGAKGKPLPWVPSQRGIYLNGRAIDRAPDENGKLPFLEDKGASVNQVMRGISEWGIRPMRGPTSDGLNYDAEPFNVNDEPTIRELEDEALAIVVGEYGVTSAGQRRRDELCAALAGEHPITMAIAGGCNAFQRYTGGVLPALNAELDHYVWMYGFETQADGSVIYLCRNQWGTSWGESGGFRLSEAAVDELGDVVVHDVSLKGAP